MPVDSRKLALSLLALRLGVFIVFFMWTVDKFINPEHALKVFEKFYYLSGLAHEILFALAAAEMLVLVGFLAGMYKKWTYGLILVAHGFSTFSSWFKYLDPFTGPNLLFFAAWPMLAACLALFLLREHDTLLTVKGAGS